MKERVKNVLNFKKPSRVIMIASIAFISVLSVGFAVNRAMESLPWADVPQKSDWPVRDMSFDRVTFGSDRDLIVYRWGREPDSEDVLADETIIYYHDPGHIYTPEGGEPSIIPGSAFDVTYYLGRNDCMYKKNLHGVYRIDIEGGNPSAFEMTGREMSREGIAGTLAGVLDEYGGPNDVTHNGDIYTLWYYRSDDTDKRLWFEVKDGALTGRMGIVCLCEGEGIGAEDAARQLVDSITNADGQILFQIPPQYYKPFDWNIHIAGRAESEDGFSMSVHEYDDVNENHSWEAGTWYSISTEDRNLTELTMNIYLPDENGDMIERSVDLLAIFPSKVGFITNEMQNSTPDTEQQSIGTTHSPDGNYFIEGYGVDYDSQVSGLNPIKQFRIVESDSAMTVWNMDGLFLFASTPPFVWSSDSRYVYVAYAGRTWKDVLVVDTTDMSERPLPGITELTPLLPDTTPDDNRPDPYIEAFSWYEHKLAVSFSWRVKEDVGNEDNRVYGEYIYYADTGEYAISTNNAGNLFPIKSEEPETNPYSFETLDYPGNHALYVVELTNGEKWTVVLSQPVRQGASGIWCVERMIDEHGNVYPAILNTDMTASDYYADRQRKADEGIGLGEGVYEGGFFLHSEATALRYLELNYESLRFSISSALLMLYPSYELKGNIMPRGVAEEPNTVRFLEIEWLLKNDTERLNALGIDPQTLPNGFYVRETHAGIQLYGLNEWVTVRIVDWDNNGQTHKPISFSEFEMLLGDENEYPRLWRLTFKNGLVSDITEQYLP